VPFSFHKLEIPDVVLVDPKVFPDRRGYFYEIFSSDDFKKAGINKEFVHFVQSKSTKGVVRGMHYQLNPHAQGKLVRVIDGELFDVAVDIRKGSPYYGRWIGEVLSSENKRMLYIPEGFAHGFCVLSDTAEMTYYCTNRYASEYDNGIIWNDSQVQIDWPVKDTVLSEKDSKLPQLKDAKNNFIYEENLCRQDR